MAEDITSEPSASPWAVCKEMFNASPGLSKRLISQTLLLTASRGCVAWGAYLVSKAVDAGALGSSPGVVMAGGAAALFAVSKIVEWALVSLHSSLHARFVLPAAHDFCDKALSCALRSKRLTGCDPVEMARRLDRKMEARNLLGSLFHHIGPPAMEALLCSAVLASMGFGVLAWALIPAAALHVWMGMAFAPKIKAKVARALANSEKTHAAAAQALEKAGLARSYGSQSVLDELVSAKSRQEKESFRRQALASDAALSLQNGLLALFAVSLFVIGFSDMRSGAVTPGAFAALIGVGASLFGQLKTLAFAFDLVASSSHALSEHVRFLREAPDAPRLSSVEPRPCAALILSDWKVERAGKVVVDVSSLCLEAGEKLYLAGASGAGKSSLLLSILGQAPSSGAIAWGEGAWRVGDSGVCAHMPQDSSSMGGTVRDNLRLGRPGAGDVEMWDALSTAGLREKIEGLGGLDAEIAWKGSNLSGGEAQRLSLARAMLSGMPLLLLDEPTSGLDAFSEMAAISAISSLSDRSAIICVHRLRAIPKASRVALMRDGKIVEDGPLEDLILAGGEFSKMWQASEST